MSNVTLLVAYLDGLEKLAENAVARRYDDHPPQRRGVVDEDVKRDIAVGAVYAGGSALQQGIKQHKKEKRRKAMWQGVASGWRNARDKANASKENSKQESARLSAKVERNKTLAAKAQAAGKAPSMKHQLSATESMARVGHGINKAPGVALAKKVGGGVGAGIKTVIKSKLGVDEKQPTTDLGRIAKSTGSVAGKTFNALSSKKTSANFRKGMQHSQIARSLGV